MKNFYPVRLLALGLILSCLAIINGCENSPVSPAENQIMKGVLRDQNNNPIPNAIMEIVSTVSTKTQLQGESILDKDTTDEDGNFAFSKVPSELKNIDLRILHPDLKPFQESLSSLISGKNKTDVQLQAEYLDSCCGRITFKVYNAKDSTILTGVEIRLNAGDDIKRKGYSNEAGQITFYEMCKNTYWVRLAKYGFNVVEKDGIIINGCEESDYVEMSIYMTPFERDSCCNGVLRIEPKDSATGDILNGATVKLRKDGVELTKKVIEGQAAIFRELCRGTYQYVILKEGYKPIETNVTLECNDSVSISPNMAEIPCCNGVLTVKVLDSLNNPIREATVILWKGGAKLGYYYTNEDGIVKFTGMCEGQYGLNVSRTGYKSIEFSQTMGCDDSVEVTKNLVSVPKDSCCNNIVKVYVKDSRTGEPLNGSIVKMFREGALLRYETVAEGVAIFREVCKGTYSFLIKREGYESVDFTVTVDCGQTYEFTKSLVSTTPYDSCCNGVIRVNVKDSLGNPLQYSVVRLWKGGTKIREVKTGADGSVLLKEICEGEFGFSINREGYKGIEWNFSMGCNDTIEFDKVLSAIPQDTCCRGQIHMTIKDENGNPLSLVYSKLMKGGTVVRDGKTNESGYISWGELCTGNYWIRIARDGYKVQEFEITIECNQVYEINKTLLRSTDTCCTAVMKIIAVDSTEARISEARVEVYLNDQRIRDGYTNSDGWYLTDGLCAPATYTIIVSKDGYPTKTLTIGYDTCTNKSATAVLRQD